MYERLSEDEGGQRGRNSKARWEAGGGSSTENLDGGKSQWPSLDKQPQCYA